MIPMAHSAGKKCGGKEMWRIREKQPKRLERGVLH